MEKTHSKASQAGHFQKLQMKKELIKLKSKKDEKTKFVYKCFSIEKGNKIN